jgi:hypothetical protein
MRSTLNLAALAGLATAPAQAGTPLTAAEFAAHVSRDTLSYTYSSGARGTADFGPGRTLLWAFEGDACVEAIWFDRGNEICFAYPDGKISACWHLYMGEDGLYGVATELASGSTERLEIHEVARSDRPLACPGPDVGV